MREIYLDNAAGTAVDLRAQREVQRLLKCVGNPSSFHNAGREAAQELHTARSKVARFLNARQGEVIFTGSGSESNSLAILGSTEQVLLGDVITTPIEHLSVLKAVEQLQQKGVGVHWLSVVQEGVVQVEELKEKLSPRTRLVSVMYANNEIGSIQPIHKIGKIVRDWRKRHATKYPLFHVDACQATGYLDMNVQQLGVDLLTLNSTKIYGPPGAAALYIRQGIHLAPLVLGGSQEYSLRAGTENIPAIGGFARALELVQVSESRTIAQFRDYFIQKIKEVIPEAKINGPPGRDRLANNVHISIPNLESEQILLELDRYGIRAGSGSACTAWSVEPSHVLKALKVPEKYLSGAIRFSLGRDTKKKDLDFVLEVLPKIVKKLNKRYNLRQI